jgi:predicted dehydrogenase
MIVAHRPVVAVFATPTTSHFVLAAQFLTQGIHVFCKKPFASTMEEAAWLLRIAESNRTIANSIKLRSRRAEPRRRDQMWNMSRTES